MNHEQHFLQSKAWGSFQEALGRQIVQNSAKDWHYQAIVERGRLGTRLYCPYGPTAKSEEALKDALHMLKVVAREHDAVFVRIEPIAPLNADGVRDLGAVKAPRDIQPKHTWRVDLAESEDALIAGMRATNRNLHRTAVKKGVSFRKSSNPKDVAILLGFIHEVARHTGIRPHSDEYFRLQAEILIPKGAAHLFFAELEGRAIAAAFVYDSESSRYYAHAGGSFEHRKLHAGTPLVSHMMLDAKASGLKSFDFYGIAPPESPNHPWAGFSDFKKSFGGHQVDYAGTWDIPLKSLPYRLYRTALLVANARPRRA